MTLSTALLSKLDLKYSDKELKHRQALSDNRARYDVIDFLNCRKEERSEAEFFCAVWKPKFRHTVLYNWTKHNFLCLNCFRT